MVSVRKTIKWMLWIVVAAGLSGGGYVYWKWSDANQLLLQNVRKALAEKAPGWDVSVGSARFDWHRRIHLYDLTLKSRDGKSEIVKLPEAVLIVDREKLADAQVVDVERVRIVRPVLNLVRDSRGKWNWQQLPPLKKSPDRPGLPEWDIEDGTVNVRLEQADGRPAVEFQLTGANVKLVPSERRAFLARGSATVRDAGKLDVSGKWHVDARSWSLDGRLRDVEAGGELLGLAVGASPELRRNVAKLEAALRKITPPDERPATPPDADAVPNLGAQATLDVGFHFDRPSPQSEPNFDVHAHFRKGRLDNPALPFPLDDLEGDVHWNNGRVELKNVKARNGSTTIEAAALVRRLGEKTPCGIGLRILDLPLDERLRKRLPPEWRRLYDHIQPQGRIDVSGSLTFDGLRRWTPTGFVLTTKDCSFSHVKFPYRFTQVNGTVKQTGPDELRIQVSGLAGRQRATFTGTVQHPGPQAATRFDLYVKDFALDESFVLACKPPMQKALRSLDVSGRADVHFHSSQSAGEDRTPSIAITADLKDCVIDYEKFPYRLSKLSGRVTFDSHSQVWTFSRLQAFNGAAKFTGTATLSKTNGLSHLALSVNGAGAFFDKPLYRALPDRLRRLWDELSPGGQFDLGVDLDWTQGRHVEVSIPWCTVKNGTMHVKSFPYTFEKINARFSFAQDRLEVLSFDARHDETRVRAAKGFADIYEDGEWKLRLNEFFADDLIPDRRFRQALSSKLRNVVDELDPHGPVSLSGMLEFRGTKRAQDPVTAAWDLKVVFAGNSLTVGTKVTNVHGSVIVRGQWDGETVDMRPALGNRLDLDSATVHGYQFTRVRGPYALYKDQLVVGSADVFRSKSRDGRRKTVDDKNRVTAGAVGGQFTLDAIARFDKQTRYRLLVTMEKARLERFAKRYLKGQRNLRGVMYGWIELGGAGTETKDMTGRGKLLISPAAIYQLPVLVQTFKVLSFVPPDKTAFTFAYADFDVFGRQFRFNTIDLVGDAISLRGRGVAKFDGKLDLRFYSMLSRNRMPVFLLKNLVSTATAGWVGIDVRGSVGQPKATIRPIPQVEDALKGFLQGLGAIPPGGAPFFPGFAPQAPPQGRRRMPGGPASRRTMPRPRRSGSILPFRIPGFP